MQIIWPFIKLTLHVEKLVLPGAFSPMQVHWWYVLLQPYREYVWYVGPLCSQHRSKLLDTWCSMTPPATNQQLILQYCCGFPRHVDSTYVSVSLPPTFFFDEASRSMPHVANLTNAFASYPKAIVMCTVLTPYLHASIFTLLCLPPCPPPIYLFFSIQSTALIRNPMKSLCFQSGYHASLPTDQTAL